VHALGATAAVVAGLTRFSVRLYSRRSSSLQGPIGARRQYAYTSLSLAELKEVRRAHGCTLNDVVLCLLSGGYRALLKVERRRWAWPAKSPEPLACGTAAKAAGCALSLRLV
jgi:hypothetical protein